MAELEKNLAQRKDQILIQLYTLLTFTGARLSEITGLLVSEVHIKTDMPYIEIKKKKGLDIEKQLEPERPAPDPVTADGPKSKAGNGPRGKTMSLKNSEAKKVPPWLRQDC